MKNNEIKYKKRLKGTVVSASSDKTIVVLVKRRFRHAVYSKYVNSTKKYHAHDKDNKASVGDVVTIIESKPFSRLKKWELLLSNS